MARPPFHINWSRLVALSSGLVFMAAFWAFTFTAAGNTLGWWR